jgi:hypothetical protein
LYDYASAYRTFKFESVDSPSWIELGGFKNAPNLGITRGKLKVSGYAFVFCVDSCIRLCVIFSTTVASFFSRSLKHIKDGLELAYRQSNFQATVSFSHGLPAHGIDNCHQQKVILVGGLASSPYIYKELQTWGTQMGISISRPDGPT